MDIKPDRGGLCRFPDRLEGVDQRLGLSIGLKKNIRLPGREINLCV